jgi:ATP-binding cassette subfamily B protein
LARLRAESVWLDPTVQLWNRSLFENVTYGSSLSERDVGAAMGAADLHDLLGSLSDGMQTRLGEGGALVSGGEGQRVRLARALAREAPRLVLLDEPFRGLDREKRAAHLARARRSWENATLLCVTHDISETLAFDRVLVLEGGRLIEDGPPETLARNDTSHYRKLLDAERSAQAALQSGDWRRLALEGGAVA